METLQTATMTNADDVGERTTSTANTQRLDMMMRSVSMTTENNTNYKQNRTTTPPPVNSAYMAIDSLDEIDNDNHLYDRKNESNRIQQPQQQAVVKKTYFSSFV